MFVFISIGRLAGRREISSSNCIRNYPQTNVRDYYRHHTAHSNKPRIE